MNFYELFISFPFGERRAVANATLNILVGIAVALFLVTR